MASGPCTSWPVIFSCDVCAQAPEVTGYAVDSSTTILNALSGGQFGLCEYTIRPCRRECYQNAPWPGDWMSWPGRDTYPQPALIGGLWYNLTCGSCRDGCSCTELSSAQLPDTVYEVVEVRVDGSPIVSGSYRLDGNLLVRLDGGTWPSCNRLDLANTEVGTWSVTATYGQPVPALAQLAMGELACQILRAVGGEDCQLPKNIASLARQGVVINFANSSMLLREGRTGLYMVDLFLSTVNPRGLRNRARAYSVDRGSRHRSVNTDG